MKNNINMHSNYDLNAIKNYLNEISLIPLLEVEEEKILFELFNKGNKEAYDKIIESNLRLVVSIANKFVDKGVPLEDLIEEGNVGLIYAVNEYDLNKGVKFSTYATIMILKYIKMAIIKYNNIHQNPKIFYQLVNLKSLYRELYMKLSRKPSIEELSNYTNIKKELIQKLFLYNYQVDSLYNYINNDSEEILLDFIIDYGKSVEDIIIDKEYIEFINFIIFKSNLLNEQEQYIFANRFGFNNMIMSYDEIGEKFNISGEAIRQKIVKVIIRLLKIYGSELALYSSNPDEALLVVEKAKNDKFKINSFKAKNRK